MKNQSKHRAKQRVYARGLRQELVESVCSKCGEYGKHFVRPSLGEKGFYICEVQNATKAAQI